MREIEEKTDLTNEEFCCQSTNLRKATSPLRIWNINQYMWDISSGTLKPIELFNKLLLSVDLKICQTFGAARASVLAAGAFPQGVLKKTPALTLNLQPGELVKVRTKEEILATLDQNGRNRGMFFNPEMLKYCGKTLRVLKRVDKMINENTKKMRPLFNTVILEGVFCDGKGHGGCQRNCYSLWREIWLRRVSNQISISWRSVNTESAL
jgi:hypothetical protein